MRVHRVQNTKKRRQNTKKRSVDPAVEAAKRIVDAQVDCVALGLDGVVVVALVVRDPPQARGWVPCCAALPCFHAKHHADEALLPPIHLHVL